MDERGRPCPGLVALSEREGVQPLALSRPGVPIKGTVQTSDYSSVLA